jgi:hypothetical protein
MAISIVHATTGATKTSSPATATIPSTTAGNCIVACIGGYSSGSTTSSISSVKLGTVDTFSSAVSSVLADVGESAIYVDPNCSGSQTSVVVTFTNFVDVAIDVYEVSGLLTSSVVDKTNSGSSSSTTSISSGATGTLSQTNEIVFGCVGSAGGLSAFPGSPWVNDGNTSIGAAGYNIVSATTSLTYTATCGTDFWTAVIASLKGIASLSPAGAQTRQAVKRASIY